MTQRERGGSDGWTLFLAFLGGALVGGAAGVLLAPASGAETRRRIREALGGGAGGRGERLPRAIRRAASAGQEAFARALRQGNDDGAGSE